MVMHPKIILCGYFGKYCCFFLKKLLYEKYLKPHVLQKVYIDFCRQTPSTPQNCHVIA